MKFLENKLKNQMKLATIFLHLKRKKNIFNPFYKDLKEICSKYNFELTYITFYDGSATLTLTKRDKNNNVLFDSCYSYGFNIPNKNELSLDFSRVKINFFNYFKFKKELHKINKELEIFYDKLFFKMD